MGRLGSLGRVLAIWLPLALLLVGCAWSGPSTSPTASPFIPAPTLPAPSPFASVAPPAAYPVTPAAAEAPFDAVVPNAPPSQAARGVDVVTSDAQAPDGSSLAETGDRAAPVLVEGDPWLTVAQSYIIQPGDTLAIKFRVTSDLNEEVTVRPDGMIAAQMIGDVPAAYQTPEQLRQILIEAYRPILSNPQLAVIVRKFAGNQVFVGGEVQLPGSIPLAGRMTTVQAIIQAGGFLDTADRGRVLVRQGGVWHELNLQDEIQGRTVGQDLPLSAYDVVVVPKSRIAKVNQFVDQYINKVIPFQRSFGFFWSYSGGVTPAAAAGP